MSEGRRRLAGAIVERSRREVEKSRHERQLADIVRKKPLTIELYGQDEHLVEGEDFELSQWVMTYRRTRGLDVDDNLIVEEFSGHLVAVDVLTDGSVGFKVKKIHKGGGGPGEEENPEDEEGEGEQEEDEELDKTQIKGFAPHGEDAGFARPEGFGSVEWNGTVEPANAIDADTWVNPGNGL